MTETATVTRNIRADQLRPGMLLLTDVQAAPSRVLTVEDWGGDTPIRVRTEDGPLLPKVANAPVLVVEAADDAPVTREYNVHLVMGVSTVVTVETDLVNPTADQLQDLAYQSSDMPSTITHGAFGQASVDEDGEWEAHSVTGPDGETYWSVDDVDDEKADADEVETTTEASTETLSLPRAALWRRMVAARTGQYNLGRRPATGDSRHRYAEATGELNVLISLWVELTGEDEESAWGRLEDATHAAIERFQVDG